VPGRVEVIGAAHSNATVTVLTDSNAIAAPYPNSVGGIYPATRQGGYFRSEVFFNNSTGAVYSLVTNLAVLTNGTGRDITSTNNGAIFLAQTPEVFGYDADGNLTNDGHWAYSWDGDNRLLRMVAPSTVPAGARLSISFSYDHAGRRISKVVSNWTGSAWAKLSDVKYLYHGWNLIASLNGTNNAVIQSFLWGLDLSETEQGAAGVGGLLAITDAANGVHLAGHDRLGNVAALVLAVNGTISANYDYGPFGEVIRATGTMAKFNPIRFSTKYQDDETDLICYI
jgi:hypothetical protein